MNIESKDEERLSNKKDSSTRKREKMSGTTQRMEELSLDKYPFTSSLNKLV